MSPTSLLRLASRRPIRPQTFISNSTSSPIRCFSQTPLRTSPKKYDEDRNSINTESNEYTKSSTDNDAAAQDQAAYDPKKTSPESELKSAERRNEVSDGSGSPLEVSGANKEVSKQRDPQEGGAEKSANEGNRSGYGSPKKGQVTGATP